MQRGGDASLFLFQNPRICTTLPKEIELFHELSSIDMEEFNISLGQLRGDIASRMSFCQLSSREEFKACLTCSLGQLQLDSLRFDNLSLHGDCERSSGENDENDNENKTLKRKHEEDTKKEDNQLKIKSNAKRMRFCEPENPEGVPAAIRPQIILDSSCSDTFPYDYDPSEGCIIGKSISREDFTSKHKYITAWAECQSETCLNGNPADNASSFSCEDMDLDAMSVDGTSSHDVSKTNFVAIESQLPSRHIEVSAQLGHLNTIQIHNEKQRNELDWPSDNVYCDCLKSRISDRVEQPTQPMNSEECDSNVSLELNCCDKLSSQSDCSTIDYNDMAVATQGCSDEPNKEACRTAGEILAERESNILSGEPNAKQCLKFSRQESNCSLYSELECFDKFSSQSDCSTIDYNDLAIVTQSCNDEPNTEACRISNEILPATQSNKLSDEAISSEGFDVALLERESNLNLQLKCCDKVSSKPDDLVDSKHIARVTQRCNEELKVEACRASNEISPQRKSIKLSDEVEVRKCLKITLVHKGCGIWAVKTSNKRKRSESESDDCIDSMNDAQAILDVGAQHRYRVFKRVKLTLTNDHPSKCVKQGSVCTTRFRSLRRLATSLREMKSRIFRWPFQKRRATVTPFLI